MRIDRLDLIAFGPFTDRVLEFAPNRVELIYGPNSAGKSTALRGLTGLLYGIAVRTTDDHVHEKKALRVGARLSNGATALDVVRRKAPGRTRWSGWTSGDSDSYSVVSTKACLRRCLRSILSACEQADANCSKAPVT